MSLRGRIIHVYKELATVLLHQEKEEEEYYSKTYRRVSIIHSLQSQRAGVATILIHQEEEEEEEEEQEEEQEWCRQSLRCSVSCELGQWKLV